MALGGYLEDALGYPEQIRLQITKTLADSYLHVRLLPQTCLYKVDVHSFPSDTREKRGRFVGIAENVGH
jgi:hypothetical protein